MTQTSSVPDATGGRPKVITVRVNGRAKEVAKEELSFDEIVRLAFDPVPTGENVLFTITYQRGHGNRPEGTLKPGELLKLKDGMLINVTVTDRS